jgi:hypothetical protein
MMMKNDNSAEIRVWYFLSTSLQRYIYINLFGFMTFFLNHRQFMQPETSSMYDITRILAIYQYFMRVVQPDNLR